MHPAQMSASRRNGRRMNRELVLELPGDLYRAIKLPSAEVPQRLRRELAVRLYDKGLLTFGKARELAEDLAVLETLA